MSRLALVVLAVALVVVVWSRREPQAARVWRTLERQPGFNERVRRGRRQLDRSERVEWPDSYDAWLAATFDEPSMRR